MKKLLTLIIAMALASVLTAQTPVGTGQTYTTLGAAFTAINNGTLTGAVVLQLVSSTTEGSSAILNASGSGGANYSSVTIYPTGSGYSVSGSIAGALIQLNGADNVTLDGRVNQAGAMNLVLSNTNTGGQTLVFINDATYNTVQYCDIIGVTTATNSGVVLFSTTTGTLGNSNNTITYCDIHDGATTPANLVCSTGTATAFNSSNTVSNSNIYNWFTAGTTSHTAGVWIGHNGVTSNSTAWTITGNSFYQTSARVYTSTGINSCLSIGSPSSGQGFTITNNYFGGSAPNCGGSAMSLNGATAIFRLLFINHAVGTTSVISGNYFQNIAMATGSASTALSLTSHNNGNVQITNNTYGSQSTVNNITMTNSGTSTSTMFFVLLAGNGATASNVEFSGNNIGGITVSGTSTGTTQLRTVYAQSPVGSTIKFNNNIVGGTVANSLLQNTNSSIYGIFTLSATTGIEVNNNIIRNLTKTNTGNASQGFCGISVASTGGNHQIDNNEIYNLTNSSSTTSINNNASIVGINMTATGVGGTEVTNNTIYNLSNLNNAATTWINGMYFATPVAPQPQTLIAGNEIYAINCAFSNSGMGGIFVPNTGNALVYNNVIRLGHDINGNDITTPLEIYGIWKQTNANVGVYHNSVFIGGTGVTGPAAEVTVAYVGPTVPGSADTVMNNIFYNARSNGTGDGTHYGIFLFSLAGLTCDYNDIYTDGTGGYLGSDNLFAYSTLPAWQAATALDALSISDNPDYTSISDLSLQNSSPAIGMAFKLNQVTDDYLNNPRGPVTTMGAYEEVAVTSPSSLTWTGAQDENWHNPYNWNGTSEIPNATTDVVIPGGVPNYPTLARNGYCDDYAMQSGAGGTATLLDNGLLTIGGNTSVQRFFSGNDVDWHLVSSPVATEVSNVFLGMYLQSFSEATNSYTQITPTNVPLNVMEGYGLYSNLANNNTVTFYGNLNLGNQSAGFTATNQGWNLLGNPFVSSIDWEAVTIPAGLSNEVHYIDAATGNDLSYVQGVGGTGSQYIPPMQGFFVAATTAGTLTVGDAERTHAGGSNFYKSGTGQLVILEASGENFSDQAWIHFNSEAGVEHDGKYDAYKRISLSNPQLPQLFSYTPQGTRLSVNGLPETLSVPLGFTALTAGVYTISAVETGLFDNVVLEDAATGLFTDLKLAPYSFDYEAGSAENRFILHFTPLATGDNLAENLNIYAYGHAAYVNVPENSKGMIQVFNVMGQEVASAPLNNTLNNVSIPQSGSYIVKVTTNEKVYTQKINIQ